MDKRLTVRKMIKEGKRTNKEMKNYDHEEKIIALTTVIRSLCEENNLNKSVVIEDFIYFINREHEKMKVNNSVL